MKHHKLFLFALMLSCVVTAQATSYPLKQDGIGGTGAPARDGIGGTGAPAASSGSSGSGKPAMNNGIGGTGVLPDNKQAILAGLAGRVLFITGHVEAENAGVIRQLTKGDTVRAGDTLKSAVAAALQLRMNDGGTIVLRAQSLLLIEAFSFNGIEDGSEQMSLALLGGGFREVTGSIGHLHKENYRIRTPNATISILGTDHEAVFVPPPPPGQTSAVAPGTYDHVISGATMLRNKQSSMLIKPNQTGFASIKGIAPVIINNALPIFGDFRSNSGKPAEAHGEVNTSVQLKEDNPAANNQINDTEHSSTGSLSGTEQNSKGGYSTSTAGLLSDTGQNANDPTQNTQQNKITQPDRLSNTQLNLDTLEKDGSYAQQGSAIVAAQLSNGLFIVGSAQAGNPGVALFAEGNVPGSYTNNVSGFNFNPYDADQLNQGAAQVDGVTVSWGIYAGGVAFNTSGKAIAINFHPYAYALASPAVVAGAMSGTATFSTLAGYTQPVTESGNTGGSVNLNVAVNLTAATITSYNLAVTDANARSWTGNLINGTPVALAAFANGTPLTVSCVGCSTGIATGSAAGLLIGANAKGLISSYIFSTGTGQAVTGAVILSRP